MQLANSFKIPTALIKRENVNEILGIDKFVNHEQLRYMSATNPRAYLNIRLGVISKFKSITDNQFLDSAKTMSKLFYSDDGKIYESSKADYTDSKIVRHVNNIRIKKGDDIATKGGNKTLIDWVYSDTDVIKLALRLAEIKMNALINILDKAYPEELTKSAQVNSLNGIGRI